MNQCLDLKTPVGESTRPRIAVCIPVFNDWESAGFVLQSLAASVSNLQADFSVVLVDDGSTDVFSVALLQAPRLDVRVLHLRRNLGHQRAIAIGLAAIAETTECDAVVVMDGDGEDAPEHVPRLLDHAQRHSSRVVVFAQRMRRTESFGFKIGYICFKVLHRVLTGRGCDVGNFSVIPGIWLKRLVCSSELWIHYAAAVACSRLPIAKVPCNRAARHAGKSQMKLTSLVVHGLSAVSVFSETVGVRSCFALGVASGLAVLSLMIVVYLRLFTHLAIPGWATNATGLLLILLVNLLLLTLNSVLVMLGGRNNANFIPSRDWPVFFAGWTNVNG